MIDQRRELDRGVIRADDALASAVTAEDVAEADRLAVGARVGRTAWALVAALRETDDLRAEIRIQTAVRAWFAEYGARLGGPALDALADVLDHARQEAFHAS